MYYTFLHNMQQLQQHCASEK